ncbi:MAG: hypothetical protein JXR96_06950 [Deltaproteobacteria bacterium]|nr:hypothetical protein [Deltaproteobacteria bacterium]
MRRWNAMAWMLAILVLGLAYAGPSCWFDDDAIPPGEVTELEGLGVIESSMRAVADGGQLDFQMLLRRSRDRVYQGVIRAALQDLDGEQLDEQVQTFRLDEGERSFGFRFSGLAPDVQLEDLTDYVVAYRVEFDGRALFGKRSVYAAAEKLEAQVLAPSRLYEGEGTFLRVLTREPVSGLAKSGVAVDVELELEDRTLSLGSGRTDANGTAQVYIQVPADLIGQGKLRIGVAPPEGGEEVVEGAVEVMREEKILLTTDKPIYQPGQLIHMRLLALKRPALTAVAGEEALFEVRDGKGNKVFKQRLATNDYGIAAADFKLATEVNMGPFEILARVGTTEALKTVEVKRYALPKFNVSFQPDRGYYLPGERVTGQIQARYFFGKPVSHGAVRVKVFTFDVGLSEIGELVGELNDEGIYGLAYDLPTVFAGVDLLQGDAYLQFDVEVTDLAEHMEKASVVSTVAGSPVKVSLVPESGELATGVENLIHVVTADPTGRPISALVTLTSPTMPLLQVPTNARGLGEFAITPAADSLSFHVIARDALGNTSEKDVTLAAGKSGSVVLLRLNRRLFQVGDTVQMTIWAADARDRIYLDVIKGNQTLLTHSLDLVDGQARFELEATPDMEGNVQFDAYYLTPESQIIRDTQLALIEGARQLDVQVSMDKEIYQPAETARVELSVKGPDGSGVPAAIGLSVVDEAVFALTEFRPGLAEVFFEVEQDILQPRYQIVGSSAMSDYLDGDRPADEREASAEVAFAAAKGFAGYGIEKNTYVEAASKVAERLSARIDADAARIVEELVELADQGIITAENLHGWLERNQGRWCDPFGQPYRIELSGSAYWNMQLVFRSSGPDELAGSPDDVSSRAYSAWYIANGRQGGYDDGWIGMEDGDMAMPGAECAGGVCGAPNEDPSGEKHDEEGGGSSTGEKPRVRSYFPETLLFEPAVITDSSGRAVVEMPLADSITTWRMTSLANSVDGRIGSRADGVLVFQDFFVDVDFPATLTRGDQVSVPVAVYNYLDVPQTISLQVDPDSWYTLQDAGTKSISLDESSVGVVYFTLQADEVGWHGLTVYGYGSEQSDAVRRTVEIVPDGKEFRLAQSDRLEGTITRTLHIPEEAIDGASRVFVKVYPGLMSQTVEGLDSLLRIPSGCFEQTTTTAWPNILVLNYLKASGLLTPEIELKARDYVNQSYQRILTFECPSGGFNWWVGDDPGNAILAAMALMMFADAQESVDLDMDVVGRTETFLVSQQQADGSWSGESHLHAGNEVYGESQLRASAFCTWGLAMSGYSGAALPAGAAYLRQAVAGNDDTYTRALVAAALAWTDRNDPALMTLLAELAAEKKLGENGVVFWEANRSTASGAYGTNGNIETTAMIVQAMIESGTYPDLVDGAITWLIQQKDTFGTWYTTQPTVQTLRAMTMALDYSASQDIDGTVRVSINGAPDVCTFEINPDSSDVTRICELDAYTVEGDNVVSVSLDGEGSFLYQAVAVYYLPWEMVSDSPDGPLSIEVSYDRTQLEVDETVQVNVRVSYNVPGERVSMIMIDLGIPPGFELVTEALTELVENEPHITRYEKRGRQLSIYVDELVHGEPLEFSYPMRAKYPIRGSCPESAVWAYYNPDVRDFSGPVDFEVL